MTRRAAILSLLASACSSVVGVQPSVQVLTGAWTFGGWAVPRPEYGHVPGIQSPWPNAWDAFRTRDREPAWGYYDEREPWVQPARLELMSGAGLGMTGYQLEWSHELQQLLMAHNVRNHPPASPVRFFTSNWDVMSSPSSDRAPYWDRLAWSAGQLEESWRAYGTAVARLSLQPNHLTHDGRPVLCLGNVADYEFYRARFGVTPARVVAKIKEGFRGYVGVDPYVLVCSTPRWFYPALRTLGVDAVTEYQLYPEYNTWANVEATYRWAWDQGSSLDVDYWVPATAGFDSRAWYDHPNRFQPTPAQFQAHVKEARRRASRLTGRVLICSWNEFGEGSALEPYKRFMLRDGDEMLRALRETR